MCGEEPLFVSVHPLSQNFVNSENRNYREGLCLPQHFLPFEVADWISKVNYTSVLANDGIQYFLFSGFILAYLRVKADAVPWKS